MAEKPQTQGTTTTTLKEKLQRHLDEAKQRMDQARHDIATLQEEDKESIRKKADEVRQRLDAQQARAQELRDRVSSWLRDEKQQTDAQVASWRKKREIKHLERRADRAEEYAVSAVVTAMMDADEAEIAVLDALDARLDAEVAAA
jgi:hypothetical protein